MLPWAQPSPQPERHLERFSHFFAQLKVERRRACPGTYFPGTESDQRT